MTDLKTIERKYSNLFQKDPYAKNKLLYHDFILQYPDSEISIARFYQTIAQDDSFFDDYPENEISLALLNDLLTLSRKNTIAREKNEPIMDFNVDEGLIILSLSTFFLLFIVMTYINQPLIILIWFLIIASSLFFYFHYVKTLKQTNGKNHTINNLVIERQEEIVAVADMDKLFFQNALKNHPYYSLLTSCQWDYLEALQTILFNGEASTIREPRNLLDQRIRDAEMLSIMAEQKKDLNQLKRNQERQAKIMQQQVKKQEKLYKDLVKEKETREEMDRHLRNRQRYLRMRQIHDYYRNRDKDKA
ncbi:hypothetical protein [Streptococcus uberis]|uniref:hypothetical protein n=1 Tax=Streptococcus uberis TaxID=1349 RepID=UPI001C98D9ED|nr:hypothetical protein [Streptococcus uberis]MBY4764582.1 hypothetical protein [Streptococcus uberis]